MAVSKVGNKPPSLKIVVARENGYWQQKRNGLKLDQKDEFVFFFSVISVTEAYLVVCQHYELAHFTPKRKNSCARKEVCA